ncbi:MAG: AIR synthase-related protein, partial [Armatimonadota bacterium]
SDLPRLCAASGVGARVRAADLPLSQDIHIAAARLDADPVGLAASGGEDYELLITCDPGDVSALAGAIGSTGSSARVIGEIVEGSRVVLVSPDGREGPMPASWQHF